MKVKCYTRGASTVTYVDLEWARGEMDPLDAAMEQLDYYRAPNPDHEQVYLRHDNAESLIGQVGRRVQMTLRQMLDVDVFLSDTVGAAVVTSDLERSGRSRRQVGLNMAILRMRPRNRRVTVVVSDRLVDAQMVQVIAATLTETARVYAEFAAIGSGVSYEAELKLKKIEARAEVA